MDLIGLKQMDRQTMVDLLDESGRYLSEDWEVVTPPEKEQALRGRTIGLIFLEPSTRSRVSFELAVRRLGGEVTLVTRDDESIQRGESAADMCETMEAMGVDGFVVRHGDRQLPHLLSDRVKVPVINAGNGSGEHPTQGLLDALTLRRHFGLTGGLEGLKVAIMGDVVHSRVARSDAFAFSTLGADVLLVGPKHLLPSPGRREQWPASVTSSRKEALQWADVVVTLRIQEERVQGNLIDPHTYAMEWGIDSSVVQRYMRDEAVILHPGPVVRGVELSNPVVDSERCLIAKQAASSVAVRQAILDQRFGR